MGNREIFPTCAMSEMAQLNEGTELLSSALTEHHAM
jgi:hypothetical protein